MNSEEAGFPYGNSRFPCCVWRVHTFILWVRLAACPRFCWPSPASTSQEFPAVGSGRELPGGGTWKSS
jgi:hypothetical protein